MTRVFLTLTIGLVLVATVQLFAGVREQRAESRFPPRGEILDVDGVRVHAEIVGNGPDLILLHGANGSTRDFTFSLMDQLADRYRVIAFDRPGLGHSGRAPGHGSLWQDEGESPQVQVRLLQAAAAQLSVTNPLVLGHSFGGSVAMAWALEDPDTAGLIMVGAASHPWPGSLHWQYPLLSSTLGGLLVAPLVTAFLPQAYLENAVSQIFAPQSAPSGYVDHFGPSLSIRRTTLRANARQVNTLRPHIVEMSARYPDLTLPIEVVHGDADDIVPMSIHSEPLAARVDSARLTVLEGIGHMPHHVATDAVIAAIDRAAARAGLR